MSSGICVWNRNGVPSRLTNTSTYGWLLTRPSASKSSVGLLEKRLCFSHRQIAFVCNQYYLYTWHVMSMMSRLYGYSDDYLVCIKVVLKIRVHTPTCVLYFRTTNEPRICQRLHVLVSGNDKLQLRKCYVLTICCHFQRCFPGGSVPIKQEIYNQLIYELPSWRVLWISHGSNIQRYTPAK